MRLPRLDCLVFVLALVSGSLAAAEVPGAISGEFSSDYRGAAVYSVNLPVPPGTGVEATLSLVYNSEAHDGLFGVGWNLDGMSSISRCPPVFAQDGRRGAIRYNSSDRLCMDGVALVATSGAYWAANTTYHTSKESWTRVVAMPDGSFTATTKEGHVALYGSTGDSRIGAPGTGQTRVWAMASYSDRNGNSLRFTYANNPTGQGEYFPLQIDYTINAAAPLPFSRRIKFSYDSTRPDPVANFSGGAIVRYTQRLTAIRSYLVNPNETEVGEMRLEYQIAQSTGRSRLSRLTQCDGVGNCYPPTALRWQDGTNAVKSTVDLGTITVSSSSLTYNWRDFNGDGRDDLLISSTTSPFNVWFVPMGATALLQPVALGSNVCAGNALEWIDFNGDGLTDLACTANTGDLQQWVRLSTGTGLGPRINFGTVQCAGGDFDWTDFNGDGREDLVCDAPQVRWVRLSQGNALGSQLSLSNFHPASASSSWADFNGDGMSDLVIDQSAAPFGHWVLISSGTDLGSPINLGSLGDAATSFSWVDLNGDGMADLVADRHSPPFTHTAIFSTGVGGTALRPIGTFPTQIPSGAKLDFVWADYNADGKADLICCNDIAATQGRSALLFNGTTLGTPLPVSNYTRAGSSYHWMDLDGDGLLDLVVNDAGTSTQVRPQWLQHAGAYPDLLLQIDNGVGGETFIDYAAITTGIYTEDPAFTFTYPTRALRGPLYVVKRKHVNDGRFDLFSYDYTYAYSGSRASLDGRGWLGFSRIVATDQQAGVSVTTGYRQDYPFTGVETSEETRDTAGTLLLRSTATYAAVNSFPGVFDVRQTADTATYFDGDKSYDRVVNHEYDAFGSTVLTHDIGNPLDPADNFDVCTVFQNFDTPSTYLLGVPAETTTASSCTYSPLTSTCSCTGVLERTRFTYTPLPAFNVAQEQSYDDTRDSWLTLAYTYDAYGNPLTVDDPTSGLHTYTYDPEYRTFAASDTNALGQVTRVEHDPATGEETQITDSNGVVRKRLIDGFGRTVALQLADPTGAMKVVRKVSRVLTKPVSDGGELYVETRIRDQWAVDDDSKWTWERDYKDALGRTYLTRKSRFDQPLPIDTATLFDNEARVKQQSLPYFSGAAPPWTTFAYDAMGRVINTMAPDGVVTTYGYSIVPDPRPGAPGNIARVVRTSGSGTPDARVVTRYLNSRGDMVRSLFGDGAIVDYSLDPLGRVLRQASPNGVVTTCEYDSLGRQKTASSSDTGASRFTYDATSGLLATESDAVSSVTYQYDALRRLTAKSLSSGTAIAMHYDQPQFAFGIGRLTSATVQTGTVVNSVSEFAYDSLGRTSQSWVTALGRRYTKRIAYDAAGRVTAMTYDDGSIQNTSYTPAGFTASASMTLPGSSTPFIANFSGHNALGQPATVAAGALTASYGYAPWGRILQQSAKGAQKIFDNTYHWNGVGELGSITDTSSGATLWSYGYGPQGYLQTAQGPVTPDVFRYGYDSAGNVTTFEGMTLAYSGQKLMSASSGGRPFASFTYQPNGALAQRIVSSLTSRYTYDSQNRLLAADLPPGQTTFDYDYSGRRMSKTDAGGTQTLYLFDDYEVTMLPAQTPLITRYMRGPMGQVASITTGQTPPPPNAGPGLTPGPNGAGVPVPGIFLFISDPVGSTSLVFDVNANVITRLAYKPFGDIYTDLSSGLDESRAKFLGLEHDASTGLNFFTRRYEDPLFGRFTVPDAGSANGETENAAAVNRYAYGGNNPVNWTDTSGEFFLIDDIIEIIAAIEISAEVAETIATVASVTAGVYAGGAAVNGSLNPGKWQWGAPKTWVGMVAGGLFGAFDPEVVGALGAELGGELAGNLVASAIVGGFENATLSAIGGERPTAIAEAFILGGVSGAALRGVGEVAGRFGGRMERTFEPDEIEMQDLASAERRSIPTDDAPRSEPASSEVCSASFVSGTPVITADGVVPIERIALGAHVRGIDPASGVMADDVVSGARTRVVSSTVVLRFADATITTTPEHPFWQPSTGWVPASGLHAGDEVSTIDGTATRVLSTESCSTPTRVYTLEVSGDHTFFVGPFGLLVHNVKCSYKNGHKGRLEEMNAEVGPSDLYTGTATNQRARNFARSMGYGNDDAGHSLARALGGSGTDLRNIFPQLPRINRGIFARYERRVRRSIQKSGLKAKIVQKLKYVGKSTRPYEIRYKFKVGTETDDVIFAN